VSKTGKKCIVSPYNKYCAYAEHREDIKKNETGVEIIDIHKLTVSTYLAYFHKDSGESYPGCS